MIAGLLSLCDKPWGASRACTKMHFMANGQSSRSILLDCDKPGSAGRKRNCAAHRQAEAFRRRAFRQVECTFGKRIGRVSAMVLQCVDNTGIEIRPEVRKGFRKTAPDQLDIALAGGPIPAEEAAHRFAFMIVMARVQCVLLVIA